MSTATAGASMKNQVSEDGNIEAEWKSPTAGGTSGGGIYDRLAQRNSENAYIEKRSEDGPKNKYSSSY
jgi:hypothetical protein